MSSTRPVAAKRPTIAKSKARHHRRAEKPKRTIHAQSDRVTEGSIERVALDLVGDAYDAALRPELWPVFFERFSNAMGGAGAGMFAYDLREQRMLFDTEVRVDPDLARAYRSYYAQKDPWVPRASELRSGSVATNSHLMRREEILKTEFYNDFIVPMGIGSICTMVVENSPTRTIFSSIVRPAGKPDFGDTEVTLASLVTPHLQRSVATFQRINDSVQRNAAHDEVLNRLPQATLLIDEQGFLIQMNRQAERIIARNDSLAIRSRRVCALASHSNSALQKLIAEATKISLGKSLHGGGTMPIARVGGDLPYIVLVTPLRPNGHGLGGPRPAVAIFVSDPARRLDDAREVLTFLYRLTAAETRIALALASGEYLQDTAERLRISIETARSQLRSIFLKTGCRRQVELVRLVLSLPVSDSR